MGASVLATHEPSSAWAMTVEQSGGAYAFSLVHYDGKRLESEKTPLRGANGYGLKALDVVSSRVSSAFKNSGLHGAGRWAR